MRNAEWKDPPPEPASRVVLDPVFLSGVADTGWRTRWGFAVWRHANMEYTLPVGSWLNDLGF